MAAKIDRGIVLYDIQMDGCLNGVYTNQDASPAGKIYSEIAKRKDGKNIEEGIPGDYICSWFDLNNTIVNGTLTITENPARVFSFLWQSNNGNYSGIGYKMNQRQIAVHYCQI